LRNIAIFEGPFDTKLNSGSLTSIAVKVKNTAKRELLTLCFVLMVTRKKARSNEMNSEIVVTIINKLSISIGSCFK